MEQPINIISPKKLTRLLLAVIVLLALGDIIGQLSKFYGGHRSLCGLVSLFDGELHGNIPNWFKAILMLISSIILFFISQIKKWEQDRFQKHWLFLSLIFLLMNIIQSADIHNALSPCIRTALGVGGWFYFAWVIPGIGIVVALGLIYLRFFMNLPPKTRLLIFIAGLTYVIGAIGLEMATAYYFVRYGMENLGYAGLSAVHEAMKMAGLVLFIHALMDLLGSQKESIRLCFSK